MNISAIFFPTPSAHGVAAEAQFSDGAILIKAGGAERGEERREYSPEDAVVDAPVIGANSIFKFTDGALLECPPSAAIEHWIRQFGQQGRPQRLSQFAHRAEASWSLAALLVVMAVVLGSAVFRFGVPAFSQWAAYRVPAGISQAAGNEVMALLEKHMLEPSKLNESRQDALRARFDKMVAAHPAGAFPRAPQLYFFGGGSIGANALALPNGAIILTDELVDISPNDDAIQGVLVHELGHVRYRHCMQMAISATAIPVLLSVVSGDLISSSQIASTLPAILLSSGYSRKFEREADQHAKQVFTDLGLSLEPMAAFFEVMEKERNADGSDSVFSTHPGYSERIKFFRP